MLRESHVGHNADAEPRIPRVGISKDAPETDKPGGKMTVSCDSISVKPGDTARFNVRVDNNPGIVAFVLRMRYDSNIVTIEKAAAGSDLGKHATLTARPLEE